MVFMLSFRICKQFTAIHCSCASPWPSGMRVSKNDKAHKISRVEGSIILTCPMLYSGRSTDDGRTTDGRRRTTPCIAHIHTYNGSNCRDPRGGATLHISILTMAVIGATPVKVPPCTYRYLRNWRDPRGGATLHISILTMAIIGATPVEVPPCIAHIHTYNGSNWRDPRGGATLHISILTIAVVGATPDSKSLLWDAYKLSYKVIMG